MATVSYFRSTLIFTDGVDEGNMPSAADVEEVIRQLTDSLATRIVAFRFYDVIPEGQMLFIHMNGQNHVYAPGTLVEAWMINIGRMLKFNRHRYTRLAYPFVPEGKVALIKTDGGMEVLTAGTRMTVDEVLQSIELDAPFRQ
jgi:hypothetical protein